MVEAVVIGGSAGILKILLPLLKNLPEDYPIPIILCLHLHSSDNGEMEKLLDDNTKLPVKEVLDKEAVKPGVVHLAPANYHLLVEADKTFSLSVDEKVNYSRPSIDVFFESAAIVYQKHLAGILLTGASKDGANGIATIKCYGGLTIVQDPAMAEYSVMPQAAVNTGCVDQILSDTTMKDILSIR